MSTVIIPFVSLGEILSPFAPLTTAEALISPSNAVPIKETTQRFVPLPSYMYSGAEIKMAGFGTVIYTAEPSLKQLSPNIAFNWLTSLTLSVELINILPVILIFLKPLRFHKLEYENLSSVQSIPCKVIVLSAFAAGVRVLIHLNINEVSFIICAQFIIDRFLSADISLFSNDILLKLIIGVLER